MAAILNNHESVIIRSLHYILHYIINAALTYGLLFLSFLQKPTMSPQEMDLLNKLKRLRNHLTKNNQIWPNKRAPHPKVNKCPLVVLFFTINVTCCMYCVHHVSMFSLLQKNGSMLKTKVTDKPRVGCAYL